MTNTHGHGRHRRWYSPRSIWRSILLRPRVYWSALVATIALATMPSHLAPAIRGALAWNCGGAVYLMLAFLVMKRCGVDVIRQRAARQDDSGIVILAIILLAIAASFAAVGELITTAKAAAPEQRLVLLVLAGSTILVSWFVSQVVFTLHYAHEHYAPAHAVTGAGHAGPEHVGPGHVGPEHGQAGHPAPGQHRGGLIFPDDEHPDYWDFFYFATSIGATSQTSDVSIRSKGIRRLVTLHAIVSFFFNTMVLAMTINLAASLV